MAVTSPPSLSSHRSSVVSTGDISISVSKPVVFRNTPVLSPVSVRVRVYASFPDRVTEIVCGEFGSVLAAA